MMLLDTAKIVLRPPFDDPGGAFGAQDPALGIPPSLSALAVRSSGGRTA